MKWIMFIVIFIANKMQKALAFSSAHNLQLECIIYYYYVYMYTLCVGKSFCAVVCSAGQVYKIQPRFQFYNVWCAARECSKAHFPAPRSLSTCSALCKSPSLRLFLLRPDATGRAADSAHADWEEFRKAIFWAAPDAIVINARCVLLPRVNCRDNSCNMRRTAALFIYISEPKFPIQRDKLIFD